MIKAKSKVKQFTLQQAYDHAYDTFIANDRSCVCGWSRFLALSSEYSAIQIEGFLHGVDDKKMYDKTTTFAQHLLTNHTKQNEANIPTLSITV